MSWLENVTKISENNYVDVERILRDHPYIKDIAKRVRERKLSVIDNLEEYIKETVESVKKRGGRVYLADDAAQARDTVRKIVGEKKLVMLSKTNVAYEVGLREYLKKNGNEVWETDLGEFLVQITNGWPVHLLGASFDMTKQDVARALKAIDPSVSESSTIEELVATVRKFLMTKYWSADVGITGANAIAADTGGVVLVENEGNIRMVSVKPEVNIAITGVDKIVPTLADAFDEAIVQAAYDGAYPPTYINMSAGPSSTADIENKRVSPATGPKEFHLILVDNGRVKASKDPELKEALLCIRCGRCYFSCPTYRMLGKGWVGTKSPYNGPMGVMWNYITNNDPWPSFYCTHSGGCKQVCPMGINIPEIISYIKGRSKI